ncbi:hypothetical protein ACJJTC_001685 [Scirpophaga incertulas]
MSAVASNRFRCLFLIMMLISSSTLQVTIGNPPRFNKERMQYGMKPPPPPSCTAFRLRTLVAYTRHTAGTGLPHGHMRRMGRNTTTLAQCGLVGRNGHKCDRDQRLNMPSETRRNSR